MDRRPDDLERHVATLRAVAQSPDDVSIGAFADAVLSLSAELRQLEREITAMRDALADALEAPEEAPPPQTTGGGPDQAAANRP